MRSLIEAVLSVLLGTGLMAGLSGCGKQGGEQAVQRPGPAQQAQVQLCDFSSGPDDAKVVVAAYYPGRHEDTLAAVKSLLEAYKGQVKVEIIDWRTKEGMKKRDAAGLTCAGVVVNGKNAFEIELGGKTSKVLFVRGIDGEWTQEDLYAVVKQELAAITAQ